MVNQAVYEQGHGWWLCIKKNQSLIHVWAQRYIKKLIYKKDYTNWLMVKYRSTVDSFSKSINIFKQRGLCFLLLPPTQLFNNQFLLTRGNICETKGPGLLDLSLSWPQRLRYSKGVCSYFGILYSFLEIYSPELQVIKYIQCLISFFGFILVNIIFSNSIHLLTNFIFQKNNFLI